jgi:hypothetical protein
MAAADRGMDGGTVTRLFHHSDTWFQYWTAISCTLGTLARRMRFLSPIFANFMLSIAAIGWGNVLNGQILGRSPL